LKNSVSSITKVQQQPNQNQCQTSAQSQFNLEPFGKHLADASRLSTISRSLLRQRLSQQHRHFSIPTTSQSSNQTRTPNSNRRFQLNLHVCFIYFRNLILLLTKLFYFPYSYRIRKLIGNLL